MSPPHHSAELPSATGSDNRTSHLSSALPPLHRTRPSSASSSSYAPVLINPTAPYDLTDDPSLAEQQMTRLNLRYPYPLPLASILDLVYTLHHQYSFLTLHASRSLYFVDDSGGPGNSDGRQEGTVIKAPTALLLTGAVARAVILVLVVGCSRRWRSRGGWVAAVCGISIGAGIWEDCAERLGARGGKGHKEGDGLGMKGQSWFLYMTILICISEYLLYLLLLRLSPPSHRTHPFSLRAPLAPRQTAVPFAYNSEELDYSPRSVRHRRYSSLRSGRGRPLFPINTSEGRESGSTSGSPSGERRAGPSRRQQQYPTDDEDEEGEDYLDNDDRHHRHRRSSAHSNRSNFTQDAYDLSDDEDNENEDDDDAISQTSSISQSSIIDLPLPMSPNRIIPPSLSVQSGLTLAMTGAQPILGGIVRRSRSARFLGRSWGSGVVLGSPTEMGRGGGDRSLSRGAEVGREGGDGQGRDGGDEVNGTGYGTFQA